MLRRLTFVTVTITLFAALAGCLAAWPAAAQTPVSVGLGVGDTSLDLSGLTSPGAYVTVLEDGAIIGSLTADASGSFSQSFPAQPPGITELSLFARDSAERISDTITTQVNLQEHFPTAVSVFLPTTLRLDAPSITKSQTLHTSGQTIPGGSVTIQLDDTNIATITADGNGNWNFAVQGSGLASGTHTVFATVSNDFGEQSYPTTKYMFNVIPLAPPPNSGTGESPAPPPVLINLATPVITEPAANATVHSSPVTVAGKGPSGAQIEVWGGPQALGSVWSDYRGNWHLPLTLSPGTYTIRARACTDNYCGKFSAPTTFTYKSTSLAQQKLQASLDMYSLQAIKNEKMFLRLRLAYGTPPFTVDINWGDGSIEHHRLSKTDTTIGHTYRQTGKFTGTVTAADQHGEDVLHFAVNVESPASKSVADKTTLWWLGAIAVILAAILILRRRKSHSSDIN